MARLPRWPRSPASSAIVSRRAATARRPRRSCISHISSRPGTLARATIPPASKLTAPLTSRRTLAQGVFNGTIQGQTNGATHFFAPAAQASLGRSVPSWASGDPTASIGGHQFYAGLDWPRNRTTVFRTVGKPAATAARPDWRGHGGARSIPTLGRPRNAPAPAEPDDIGANAPIRPPRARRDAPGKHPTARAHGLAIRRS